MAINTSLSQDQLLLWKLSEFLVFVEWVMLALLLRSRFSLLVVYVLRSRFNARYSNGLTTNRVRCAYYRYLLLVHHYVLLLLPLGRKPNSGLFFLVTGYDIMHPL